MAAAASSPRRTAPEWDEQIRWRLARGEETALGELYDRFAPLVHGLAGCILEDRKAAQQLTREVFAHLWEHPESFDPAQGSLRSWLGALTRRRALDRLRLLHTDDRELQARAGAARTQYVVESLPDPLRETLAVTYFDGRTYQETALRLGISEQDAKQRIRLGLQLLAGALGRDDGEGASEGDSEETGAGRSADGSSGGVPGSAVARERAGRTEPVGPDAGRTGAEPACPVRAHAERRRTDAAGAST
ncbi:sigma-70 family RNA polymerase sigma factor [Saccharothrix sp. ST-888]|uniref:sigma-70 family RNA polymerase sigma factor n=1 Tax=Saccharothrix sp. ST-888 TaxID=1427391 RepID=UPI0007C783AD|nr:sigma-70 family RNA polymerase sigma factor [Saccharothrix sp. ST-888]